MEFSKVKVMQQDGNPYFMIRCVDENGIEDIFDPESEDDMVVFIALLNGLSAVHTRNN